MWQDKSVSSLDRVEDRVVAADSGAMLVVFSTSVEETKEFRLRGKHRASKPYSKALEGVSDNIALRLL